VRVHFSLLVPALLVAGCATGGDFPSLAPRAVEQLSMEEPVRVDPPVAPNPALRGEAEALLARARTGDRAFEGAYARALPLARAAGPANSDSWVQAQEAISRAEAARAETTSALAELDRLVTDRADDPTNETDHAALMVAFRAAEALANDQHRRLAGLRTSVSR
jgi:hypothetical protein